MFDITALPTFVLPLIGIVSLIAILRVATGDEPGDLAQIFGRPWELAWPRGVQEEEPRPWRFDLLERHGRSAATAPRRLEVAPSARGTNAGEAGDAAA